MRIGESENKSYEEIKKGDMGGVTGGRIGETMDKSGEVEGEPW